MFDQSQLLRQNLYSYLTEDHVSIEVFFYMGIDSIYKRLNSEVICGKWRSSDVKYIISNGIRDFDMKYKNVQLYTPQSYRIEASPSDAI